MGLPLYINCWVCRIYIEDTGFWKVLLSDNGLWERWLNVTKNGILVVDGGTWRAEFSAQNNNFYAFSLHRDI